MLNAVHKNQSAPAFTADLGDSGRISVIHFSQFELSQDLLLVAFPVKILLARLNFQENLELEKLAEFSNGVSCTSLAFSPETALTSSILFCSAGSDYKIRMFKSDLNEDNICKILPGHFDYINDIAYDPDNNFLASVSDDNTAKIWSTSDYTCVATLLLTSAGMSACWHREDPLKLMVAERAGIVRFYNANTQQPLLSLDYGKPLAGAHWAPSDSQLVCSLHLGEIVLWDLTNSSQATQVKLLHTSGGGSIKMNSLSELIATVSPLDNTLKVSLVSTQQQRLSVAITLPTNPTWHYRVPILCIGDDNKLYFYKVSPK